MKVNETMDNFAKLIVTIAKSDRDILIGVGGFTGEGKSCFMTKLCESYGRQANIKWNYTFITWSRAEMMQWIEGKGDSCEGQLPEYNAILADELISMFYRRNWYEDPQKGSIELLNKCRDRHLLIVGGVPVLWDLDTGILSRFRFYVYIAERGKAWVFQQENNPFGNDPWNVLENKKIFRKKKNPYSCPNFVCEILFDDWSPDEKKAYYALRNSKRRNTELQNKTQNTEKYREIKEQRNKAVRKIFSLDPKLTNNEVGDLLDMSTELIRLVRIGDE
jgi:hypothetical protein